jgi:Uma2 family endonuclease
MVNPKPKIKFTYEDYKNAPEDKRYELLDGELVLVPSPKEAHQRSSIRLAMRLELLVESTGIGYVYAAPFDVVLSNTDVVQPDLMFISNERSYIITADNIQGAPDLVIEILSPSTAVHDRDYKLRLYAQHGVREYWVMDTVAKTIEVLRPGEHGFEHVATYRKGDVLTSPLLKGLELNVGEVF